MTLSREVVPVIGLFLICVLQIHCTLGRGLSTPEEPTIRSAWSAPLRPNSVEKSYALPDYPAHKAPADRRDSRSTPSRRRAESCCASAPVNNRAPPRDVRHAAPKSPKPGGCDDSTSTRA